MSVVALLQSSLPDDAALPSSEAVRQALERVLQRPEFQKAEPSLAELVQRAIGDAFRSVFDTIQDLMGDRLTGGWVETLVWIGLLVVLAALLAHLAWSVLQLRVPAQGEGESPGATPGETLVSERQRAGLAEASRLAASGAFAEAMHALYHGAVLGLDERGLVRAERFKTGADYAADLGPALRPSFRSLLSAYYPVAFGGRRAGEPEWLAMRGAATDLGLPA